MTPKFQNRLVGAIVLISLGVIILPDLFDGQKEHFQENFQPIPARDKLDLQKDKVNLLKPVAVDDVSLPKALVSDITLEHKSNNQDKSEKKEEKNTPLAQEEKAIEQHDLALLDENIDDKNEDETAALKQFSDSAWIIRLATFSDHQNAKKLAEKLKSQGYLVQIKPRELKKGDLARVEVGPELSKEKILSVRAELEKSTGLKGQVIKFNPVVL